MESGDTLSVTFSEPLATPSNATASISETDPSGSGNDTLTIAGVTTTANTGSNGYETSNKNTATFGSSTRVVSGATITATVAGTCAGGGCATLAASQGALVFVPDAGITDASGNAAAGTFTTASNFKPF